MINFQPIGSRSDFILSMMRESIDDCIYPIISSGVIIYFLLKEKLNNHSKTNFLYILIATSAVTFVIPLSKELEDRKNRMVISKSYFEQKQEAELRVFNSNGLTFSYPNNWEVEKEVVKNNSFFSIKCEAKDISDNFITIAWDGKLNELTPYEMIELAKSTMIKNATSEIVEIDDSYTGFYGGNKAVFFKYSNQIKDIYLISFEKNGKVFFVVQQISNESTIDSGFKLIENSLTLE